ncbi:MAG TPA: hypothetical protein VN455_04070, partial [Methanotrichaceae archaeon]|nr:hypothetical protein [Methanotrichaceae archaeon]
NYTDVVALMPASDSKRRLCQMSDRNHHEGLKAARLLMVLSSFSPLFLLWAIRGNILIPDLYLLIICGIAVIIPNATLWLRIWTAIRLEEKREITIGRVEDNRDHILVYLFSMLLPFYAPTLSTWRDLAAELVAIAFIIFLFWHLNLHYMNILFAILGYRVFTIYAPTDENVLSGRTDLIIITKRVTISSGHQLSVYRLSDTVYLEV